MPGSNTTGGKHHKKGKKNKGPSNLNNDNKIEFAGANQVYSIVKKKIGGKRIVLECSDGKERSGMIPGKLFKKVWLNVGDILLCELDIGSDDSRCHILSKYSAKDANVLKSQGKITFDITEEQQNEVSFKFGETNQESKNLNNMPDIANIRNNDNSDSDDDFLIPRNQNRVNVLKNNKQNNKQNKNNNDNSNSNSNSNDDNSNSDDNDSDSDVDLTKL